MKTIIQKLFNAQRPTADQVGLSELVYHASSKEQSRFIKKVIRESNKDQKDLVAKYNKQFSRV
jgi:hypothetical protein